MTLTPELFAILVQGAAIVFLAGRAWSRLDFHERRIAAVESQIADTAKAGSETLARLARIEEKLNQLARGSNGRRY
jgi:hypothetical protein